MGVTAVSAVTPTVIVALSAHHALSPAVIDSDSKQQWLRTWGGRGAGAPPLLFSGGQSPPNLSGGALPP